jgi:hypothetical protein
VNWAFFSPSQDSFFGGSGSADVRTSEFTGISGGFSESVLIRPLRPRYSQKPGALRNREKEKFLLADHFNNSEFSDIAHRELRDCVNTFNKLKTQLVVKLGESRVLDLTNKNLIIKKSNTVVSHIVIGLDSTILHEKTSVTSFLAVAD